MFYKKHYYYFRSALSEKLCDDIIQVGLDNKIQTGTTAAEVRNEKQLNNMLEKRNSKISWIDDVWLKNELRYYVSRANKKAGWNFDLTRPESAQFTIYDKNEYYGWHTDSDGTYYEYEKQDGLIRKLSVTVSLSHPHEYDGGVLEFDPRQNDEPNIKSKIISCNEILPKGSICVFPSFTHHRITPVTRGRRLSLVQWNLGPEYR